MVGFRKQGLVHISQLADFKVESTAEFVSAGDEVFVKVISLGDGDGEGRGGGGALKISLSMKYVSQGDGRDLDPGHAQSSMDGTRNKVPSPNGGSLPSCPCPARVL